MQRTQYLTLAQQRAVEQLARRRGTVCLHCGETARFRSGERAVRGPRYVNVELFCANPDADHPENILALDKSFPLEPYEAASIGLAVPPGEPPPRRRPGETFPR